MGTSILDLKTGSCIFRPSLILPNSGGYGRLYNWYTASSVSYGALYNWYAITDSRNIAPIGWHVPSKAEFDYLHTLLSNTNVNIGNKLKTIGTSYWQSPNTGATNESGFSALGSGYRTSNGSYEQFGIATFFAINEVNHDFTILRNDMEYFPYSTFQPSKKEGISIRLIKDDSIDPVVMTDNDGYKYPTIKIGDQVWMAQNLQTTKYRDGSNIPNVTDNAAWAALSTGAYCWYNNTKTYDLAPAGWHLYSINEFQSMFSYLGNTFAGGAKKLRETGIQHWSSSIGATNETGFTAVGSGYRNNIGFTGLKNTAQFHGIWTSNMSFLVGADNLLDYGGGNDKSIGNSIRFIRNANNIANNVTDADGNIYESVKFNNQTWLKQNWKSKKYRDGTPISFAGTNGINYTNAEWSMLNTPAVCAYNNDENLV